MSGWADLHFIEQTEQNEYNIIENIHFIGYKHDDSMKKHANVILDNINDDVDMVAISHANDTSDSGSAQIYDLKNGQLNEVIDSYEGYEGARGADTQGEIRDAYGINLSVWRYGGKDADEFMAEIVHGNQDTLNSK